MGTRGHHKPGAPAQHKKLCVIGRRLPWTRQTPNPSDGNMAFTFDRFEWKYNKYFAGNHLFGEDIVDWIHKTLHVFLHSCNMTLLDGVNIGALSEFGDIQKWVDQENRVTPPLPPPLPR